MLNVKPRIIVYGKVVDDKEDGIFIEDVYFGGIANDETEADELKKLCTNHVRGGYAVTRTFEVKENNSLPTLFSDAKKRFTQIEREMIENELVLEANNERSKKRR